MNRTKEILVIEDNHEMRVCFRQVLEDNGYCVHTAANGKDALNFLKHGLNPHLIILDINMPIMSGEEFLKAAKQSNFSHIPTFVITGDHSISDSYEVSYFTTKPVDLRDLVKRVKSCVEV